MDLDSFLDKKSKKLAGVKKKAKTGELSNKERVELGLDVFAGLDAAATNALPVQLTERNGDDSGNDNDGDKISDTNKDTTAASPTSPSANVLAPFKTALEDPNGAVTPTTLTERKGEPGVPNVFVRVVNTSERKAKGWDAARPAAATASVEDLIARVAEKTGPQKFVARGNERATGAIAPKRGWPNATAELPTLEEVAADGQQKKNEGQGAENNTTSGAYQPPTDKPASGAYQPPTDKPASGVYKPSTDKPASGAYQPPTDKPASGVYKPPTDKPASGAYQPPTDKPASGAYQPPTDKPASGVYKPPTDKPASGAYQPPTDKPASGAYQPPTDKPASGAYQPPTDKPSFGAYKPPTDRPSFGAYKPPTDKPYFGAYRPPTDKPASGAYKPPTDRPSAGVYKPPNRTSTPPPS